MSDEVGDAIWIWKQLPLVGKLVLWTIALAIMGTVGGCTVIVLRVAFR